MRRSTFERKMFFSVKRLLCPLSRNILWIFFSYLPGNFALKNGGDFWWIFSGLRFPRNEAWKLLKNFGENSERNSGQNSGQKFEKFGELSFCDFSDLTKGGRHSVNEGFGKDSYKQGNSVKRSGPFNAPLDSENWKVAALVPCPKISS